MVAALDPQGRLVGTESFSADTSGYEALLGWLEEFDEVTKVGVEGTSLYGTGLARLLRRNGVEVVEVDRQNRQNRRNQGKSDPLDAVDAARASPVSIVRVEISRGAEGPLFIASLMQYLRDRTGSRAQLDFHG